MQEYVQKSIRTTLPRRDASVSGVELSHRSMPAKSGAWPKSRSWLSGSTWRLARQQAVELALGRARTFLTRWSE